MTLYLMARRNETPAEAWEDSEGLYHCSHHLLTALRSASPEYRLVAVPDDMADMVANQGQCAECWEDWADGLRRDSERQMEAEIEDLLRRHGR